MSSTPSTTTPAAWHQFERKVEQVKPSKNDINFLVMDYLVSNGYPKAATKFADEANLKMEADRGSIDLRVKVREDIYAGRILSAIEKINDIHPNILDCNTVLHFSLLQLHLIELIRKCIAVPDGDLTPALEFATAELAPRAPAHPILLEELEKTLSLLIFPVDNTLSPALAELLNPELRKRVATRVNWAILKNQGSRCEARIRPLMRLRAWSELKARQHKKDIPEKLEIGLDGDASHSNPRKKELEHDGEDVVMQEQTDSDPMVS